MNPLKLYASKTYRGTINRALLDMMPKVEGRILDVGCGDGANAAELRSMGAEVWGLTASAQEAKFAEAICHRVVVTDLEAPLPTDLPHDFEGLFVSHVLEHLQDPARSLCQLAEHLKPGGWLLVAVPNMAFWKLRVRFFRGDWHRQNDGAMDATHRQFWSYETAPTIFDHTPFELIEMRVDPLTVTNMKTRQLMPHIAQRLDERAAALAPNLFGWQTMLLAHKRDS